MKYTLIALMLTACTQQEKKIPSAPFDEYIYNEYVLRGEEIRKLSEDTNYLKAQLEYIRCDSFEMAIMGTRFKVPKDGSGYTIKFSPDTIYAIRHKPYTISLDTSNLNPNK